MITLKAARVNAGLTQGDAAKKIGVSKNTLISWEKYRKFPSVIQAKKIAEIYKLSYDKIMFCPERRTE